MRCAKVLSVGVLAIVAGIGLSSCAKQVVKFTGDANVVKQWKKTALVELVVGPPQLPIFPLLDAGIYRGSFNGIAPQLLDVHSEKVNELTDAVGEAIKTASGGDCIYGKQLVASPGYAGAGIEEKPLTLKHKVFPEIAIATGTKNLLDFSANDFVDAYLDNTKPPAEVLAKLASSLQVDGTVIGVISVPTLAVSAFGLSGSKMGKIALYFFDAQGKFCLKGYGSTLPSMSGPGNIEHYTMTLEKVGLLSKDLAAAIYQNATK